MLVHERIVVTFEIDTASLDHSSSGDFIVHQIAVATNVVGFETIANLEPVTVGSQIVILPLKIGQRFGGRSAAWPWL